MLLVTAALALVLSEPIGASSVATEAEGLSAAASRTQTPAAAQPDGATDPKEQPADAKEPPTPEHTGLRALFGNLGQDIKHLPAMENLSLAVVGGWLALAAHPADATFNAHLQSESDAVSAFFAPGKYLGNTPEQVAFSLGTYA